MSGIVFCCVGGMVDEAESGWFGNKHGVPCWREQEKKAGQMWEMRSWKQLSAAQRSSSERDGLPGDVVTAREQHPLHHMEENWHREQGWERRKVEFPGQKPPSGERRFFGGCWWRLLGEQTLLLQIGEPVSRDQAHVLIFLPWRKHGSAHPVAPAAQLEHKTRGAAADRNPIGDVQYCNIEEIGGTGLPGEAGMKDIERDKRRKFLRVFSS